MPFGPVAAAVAGGVASAGVGALLSGKQSSQAATGASNAQANLQPFVTPGVNALNQSSDLLGLNGPDAATKAMSTYQTSPGYQFQMDQGLRAVDAGAAGKGILRSGATLKAEQTFGQGLADSDFSNYYSRLAGLATLGETAGAGGAELAQSAGNTQANITGNLGAGLSNTVNSLFSNPKVVSGINSLFSPSDAGGGVDSGTFSF